MTWTYDPTSTADLDVVRRYIGDTNTKDQILADEELTPYIDVAPTLHAAAADAIDFGILPKIARDVDSSGVGISTTRSQKTMHYKDLAKNLRSRSGSSADIYVGGASVSTNETYGDDTSLVQPQFMRGMHSN